MNRKSRSPSLKWVVCAFATIGLVVLQHLLLFDRRVIHDNEWSSLSDSVQVYNAYSDISGTYIVAVLGHDHSKMLCFIENEEIRQLVSVSVRTVTALPSNSWQVAVLHCPLVTPDGGVVALRVVGEKFWLQIRVTKLSAPEMLNYDSSALCILPRSDEQVSRFGTWRRVSHSLDNRNYLSAGTMVRYMRYLDHTAYFHKNFAIYWNPQNLSKDVDQVAVALDCYFRSDRKVELLIVIEELHKIQVENVGTFSKFVSRMHDEGRYVTRLVREPCKSGWGAAKNLGIVVRQEGLFRDKPIITIRRMKQGLVARDVLCP